jgi:hypothetical protein
MKKDDLSFFECVLTVAFSFAFAAMIVYGGF